MMNFKQLVMIQRKEFHQTLNQGVWFQKRTNWKIELKDQFSIYHDESTRGTVTKWANNSSVIEKQDTRFILKFNLK